MLAEWVATPAWVAPAAWAASVAPAEKLAPAEQVALAERRALAEWWKHPDTNRSPSSSRIVPGRGAARYVELYVETGMCIARYRIETWRKVKNGFGLRRVL